MLDDYLSEIPVDAKTLLKIDTEGSDFNVLKGARRFLSRENVCALVEITDAWLREQGQSAAELFAFMEELGYQSFHPRMRPRLWRQDLVIEPVSLPGPHHHFDALFSRIPIQEH